MFLLFICELLEDVEQGTGSELQNDIRTKPFVKTYSGRQFQSCRTIPKLFCPTKVHIFKKNIQTTACRVILRFHFMVEFI